MTKTAKILFMLLIFGVASITFTSVYGDKAADRIEKLHGQIDKLHKSVDVLHESRVKFLENIDARIEALEQKREAKNNGLVERIQNILTKIDNKQERIISLGGNITDTIPYNLTITPINGTSVSGCEKTTLGCESPLNSTMALGGTITFHNTDNVAHTWYSGLPSDDDFGSVFASSLVLPGNAYEWTPDTVGNQPWSCIVHPWITNIVTVVTGY